jgi:hypothetical protein
MRQVLFQPNSTREEISTALDMVPAIDGSPKTPIMNVPHGDNSLAPKGLNLHQFIGCNVNGMPMEQKYAKVKEIGEGMVEHQANFGGFT